MKLPAILNNIDPRLAADLKRQKRAIGLGLACTAVASALKVGVAGLIKLATSAIQDLWDASLPEQVHGAELHAKGTEKIIFACVMVVVLFAARYVFTRGTVYYLSLAANKLAADLRVRMFDKLLRLPISYFTERRAGAIQSVLTNDVNVYQNAVGIFRDSIEGPVQAIGAIIMIFVVQWQLALAALLLIPPMAIVIERNAKRMRGAQHQVQSDLSDVSAMTVETLQGTRVVKSLGAEDRVNERYQSVVHASLDSQMKAVSLMATLRPMVEFIGACALALVFYLGGTLAGQHVMQVGSLAAVAYLMDTVNQGFRSLGGVRSTYAGVQAASERIYSEILDVPEAHEAVGARQLENLIGRIEFQNVTFKYPDGTCALSDVSFAIEPGTSLAMVGPSGAGKSTIADLLLRFYEPTEGRILLDGVDLRELDVQWLRHRIGVVPQQTFLFAGSIEDNLRLGAPNATAEDLAWALEMAHATEFTRELASRTHSELGERGNRLSGGQMQRIAIARALVSRPTLLLLDEATSALDATSEKAVTDALDDVMKTRTTLFIAHRLTTAARADKILVLSRGQVVEQGSHEELMTANGAYAGLFRAFTGGILG